MKVVIILSDGLRKNTLIDLYVKTNQTMMKEAGRFKILNSFKITGRGLVASGDLLDGKVKIGNYITFSTGIEDITLKISDVGMADNISTKEFWVELTFVYTDENEKKKFEELKIPGQIVAIMEE